MKKNNEETILRTISLVDGEIQNVNGVIYNIESLKNSEKNFLKDNNKLDYFIGYEFESEGKLIPYDEMTPTIKDAATIKSINNDSINIMLNEDLESIEANDVRVAYRMTGDFKIDEDGKKRYHIDKIVGMDIMPKENFNK